MADNTNLRWLQGGWRSLANLLDCFFKSTGAGTDADPIIPLIGLTGTNTVVLGAGSAAVGGTKDNGPQWTSVFGVSGAYVTSADASSGVVSITDAPTSAQKIVVTDILVSADTAMRVRFSEETSGTIVAAVYLPANGTVQITPRSKLKLATADKKLQMRTSVAGNIAVTTLYTSEA